MLFLAGLATILCQLDDMAALKVVCAEIGSNDTYITRRRSGERERDEVAISFPAPSKYSSPLSWIREHTISGPLLDASHHARLAPASTLMSRVLAPEVIVVPDKTIAPLSFLDNFPKAKCYLRVHPLVVDARRENALVSGFVGPLGYHEWHVIFCLVKRNNRWLVSWREEVFLP